MGLNLRDVKKNLRANILAGNATIIVGPPGCGKTEVAAQEAIWWRDQHPGKSVGLSCFFMATQSPIGFTGLPWKGTRSWKAPDGNSYEYTVTDPAIPQWFMATDLRTGEVRPGNTFDSVFLLIEEWGQGSAETKRAGAEVLRAGGTPPWFLPPGSPRVALSNTDARDGVTKEFDFIIGRRCEIEVSANVDIWIEDFADKPYQWQGRTWDVLGVTKAWAKQHPESFNEPKPAVQGPWCNARSLTQADRYVQAITHMNGEVTPVNDHSFVSTLRGYMGMGAATSYVSHLQFRLELPALEDIVRDPHGTPVPTKVDLQMLMAYEMAGRVRKDQLAPVLAYMDRLPKDMKVTFVSSLLRRDHSLLNDPVMTAWTAKHAALIHVIASLSK